MRKLACISGTLALVAANLSLTSVVAYGSAPLNPCPLTEAGVYECPLQGQTSNPGQHVSVGSPSGGGGHAANSVIYVPHKRISADPNGNACVETIFVPAGTPARPDFGLPDTEQGPGGVSGLYETAPPCPQQPRVVGSGAAVTPLTVALSHWARIPLPRPQPRIEPGRAITGKRAYLEVGGAIAYMYQSETVFGVLEIVANGRHFVDWGDGASSGPHTTDGAPWPVGEIVHDYLTIGAYDVVVTTEWTATWRLDRDRGILPPTETTGRIDNFPVQQIQAVITR